MCILIGLWRRDRVSVACGHCSLIIAGTRRAAVDGEEAAVQRQEMKMKDERRKMKDEKQQSMQGQRVGEWGMT